MENIIKNILTINKFDVLTMPKSSATEKTSAYHLKFIGNVKLIFPLPINFK